MAPDVTHSWGEACANEGYIVGLSVVVEYVGRPEWVDGVRPESVVPTRRRRIVAVVATTSPLTVGL